MTIADDEYYSNLIGKKCRIKEEGSYYFLQKNPHEYGLTVIAIAPQETDRGFSNYLIDGFKSGHDGGHTSYPYGKPSGTGCCMYIGLHNLEFEPEKELNKEPTLFNINDL